MRMEECLVRNHRECGMVLSIGKEKGGGGGVGIRGLENVSMCKRSRGWVSSSLEVGRLAPVR